MKKLKKALIPAAGLGTRFLPATKTVPKEMLPIVDRPTLLYIVEEAVQSGIEDIVIISGRGKTAIDDFFDCSVELESYLEQTGKSEWLEQIVKIRSMANFISIRQKEALGLGHAVLCGQTVIGDEDFAVLLGDEIMYTPKNFPTVIEQIANVYYETKLATVAVMNVKETEVEKYGIIDAEKNSSGYYQIKSVVEKPKKEDAPSQLALPGRYIFTAKIFDALKTVSPGKNGEIQLTDAMTKVAQNYGMLATEFQATRYDAGDRLGYLIANIEFALRRDDLSPKFKLYLQELVKNI